MASRPWYLDPTFLPAAFGLIGVIVGGLITAGSAFILEQRREQGEQQKEQRTHDTEVRTAARLVDLDFRIARACAKISIQHLEWYDTPREPLTCQHWDKYRATLASELPLDDWITVLTCVLSVSEMSFHREQVRRENKMTIDSKTVEFLQTQIERLKKVRSFCSAVNRKFKAARQADDM